MAHIRRTIAASFAILPLAALPAFAGNVAVPMDEVRLVTLDKPATTVFVGNPTIADITVVDAQHVFVLGKSFGTTNLIGIDSEGKQLFNDYVTVAARSSGTVTLYRGTAASTMTCAGGGRCQASPMPGDANETFGAVTGQTEAHTNQNVKAAMMGQ